MAVDQNFAFIRNQQTADQHGQRRFSGAVHADNGDFLPGVDGKTDVVQNFAVGVRIRKADVAEFNPNRFVRVKRKPFAAVHPVFDVEKFAVIGDLQSPLENFCPGVQNPREKVGNLRDGGKIQDKFSGADLTGGCFDDQPAVRGAVPQKHDGKVDQRRQKGNLFQLFLLFAPAAVQRLDQAVDEIAEVIEADILAVGEVARKRPAEVIQLAVDGVPLILPAPALLLLPLDHEIVDEVACHENQQHPDADG